MAQQATEQRIKLTLRSASLLLDELGDRVADWDQESGPERADFGIDWDNSVVGDIEDLLAWRNRGDLSAAQKLALDRLLERLPAVKDQARRLDLWWPTWLEEEVQSHREQADTAR